MSRRPESDLRLESYFFSSFFASGDDGEAEGDVGEAEDDELEPEVPPDEGVDGLDEDEEGDDGEDEDGEDDGEELIPFFEASSPHAARVNAATAAISRDLVIPGSLKGIGAANSRPRYVNFPPFPAPVRTTRSEDAVEKVRDLWLWPTRPGRRRSRSR
jgi:hypothetical protein